MNSKHVKKMVLVLKYLVQGNYISDDTHASLIQNTREYWNFGLPCPFLQNVNG